MTYIQGATAGYRRPVAVETRAPRRILRPVSDVDYSGPLGLARLLVDGVMDMTPEIARRLLSEGYYSGQADRHKTAGARGHIEMFMELVETSAFRGDSNAIYIGIVDGVPYLLDGYHRCTAISEAGKTVKVRVVLLHRDNMDEIAKDYATHNRGTRPRSLAQVSAAFPVFPEDSPVIKTVQAALSKSVIAIATGFSDLGKRALPGRFNTDTFRFEQQRPYVEACEAFQTAMEHRPYRKINPKLLRPAVFGVAVITLRHQPERGLEFWSGVFDSAPLDIGDPRRVLYETINSRSGETMRGMASIVETAWRKWNKRESVQLLRAVRDTTEPFGVYLTTYKPVVSQ